MATAKRRRPAIEPITIKRRNVGFRGYDKSRASPGFTIFAPIGGTNRSVHLIDIEGNEVHRWDLPYAPGLYGYLTERGTLFYNGKVPSRTWLGKQPFMGGAAMEVDWKGRVLWEVNHPEHHHDGIRLKNGNIMLLCAKPLPPAIARRVRGGRAGTDPESGMLADYLVEMTTSGEKVWEWRTWDHLDPVKDAITAMQDPREEWTHANTVHELPSGDLLMSFRNISTVIRVNRRSGRITWKLGVPPLSGQHAPHLLKNGNYLLFDNGPHRVDESLPFSRVLEIEPRTKKIVWKYQEPILSNFFSPRISNATRLPNGNTLVNEGNFGRFFEVTRRGETVWEYVNPHFAGPPKTPTNAVFRCYRYSAAEIARARRAR